VVVQAILRMWLFGVRPRWGFWRFNFGIVCLDLIRPNE
jgi:hypothetical protein